VSTDFASWVQPIADRFWTTRREVAEMAGKVPGDAWERLSPVEGWTYRDVLSHLAEGDVSIKNMIRTVLDGGDTDFRTWNNGREERVAGGLRRGASLTVDQLIAQVLRDGEETQQLLARLSDGHQAVQVIASRTNPAPLSLAECLSSYHHDEEHIEHLRPAITAEGVAR